MGESSFFWISFNKANQDQCCLIISSLASDAPSHRGISVMPWQWSQKKNAEADDFGLFLMGLLDEMMKPWILIDFLDDVLWGMKPLTLLH